jgi:hypothetical protein
MKDISKSFSILKHIHYFFYYTGILTLPLLLIYPAIMLSLGIFSKITILQSNRIIPCKRILCIIILSYYYKLSIINILYNLCLIPILLLILFVFKLDYLCSGYNYNKLYNNV